MSAPPFDIMKALEERHAQQKAARDRIKANLDSVSNEIRELIGMMPKGRPRFRTVADVEEAIASIEHDHKTRSVSLQEEKRMLKEIRTLRASTRDIAEQGEMQQMIDDLKLRREELRDTLSPANAAVKELSDGLRKIGAARQIFLSTGIDVPPSEIVTAEEVVLNKHIPYILGSTKERIEATHGVTIDVAYYREPRVPGQRYERPTASKRSESGKRNPMEKRVIRMMGTFAGTEAARVIVQDIASSLDEEVETEKWIVAVLRKRTQFLDQIEAESGARVKLPWRGPRLTEAEKKRALKKFGARGDPAIPRQDAINVRGKAEQVKAVKAALATLAKSAVKLTIFDVRLFGVLIGSGGETVREVEEATGADVNVVSNATPAETAAARQARYRSKARAAAPISTTPVGFVRISALDAAAVAAAKKIVSGLIETNKENIVSIAIPQEVVPLLIGKDSGFPLRSASATAEGKPGARVRINDARRDVAAAPTVEIKGTAAAIARVRSALAAIVAKFESENTSMSLELSAMDKSSKAAKAVKNAVRHCGANADEANRLRIEVLRREAARVAEAFGAVVRPMQWAPLVEGQKRDYRVQRPADPIVRFRGAESAVAATRAALDVVINSVTVLQIPVDPLVLASVIGKKGATIKKLQAECDAMVELAADDAEATAIVIAGTAEMIAQR